MRTCPVPALSAGDEPVHAVQVQATQRTEQRLGGDETDRRRHLAKVIDATQLVLALDAYADPDIARPGQSGASRRSRRDRFVRTW